MELLFAYVIHKLLDSQKEKYNIYINKVNCVHVLQKYGAEIAA